MYDTGVFSVEHHISEESFLAMIMGIDLSLEETACLRRYFSLEYNPDHILDLANWRQKAKMVWRKIMGNPFPC